MSILSSRFTMRKCQLCGEEKRHEVRTRTQLPFPACIDCMDTLPPIPDGMRRCPNCLDIHNKKGNYYCRVCANTHRRKHHSFEKGRAWALRYHYDISPEEYDLMLFQQAGVCAICGKQETARDPRTKKIRSLAVDHDHENGNVRALLCSGCNSALRALENDPERYKAMKKYMKKYGIGG